jgi:amino acid transporter
MNVLARHAGLPPVVGILIDLGGIVSFFSCMLACVTASARVLYLMGQKGALHALLGKAHTANQTPHRAVVVSGLAVLVPLGALIFSGIPPTDVYGLLGTLATFGFLTAYVLVSIAAPIFLHRMGRLTTGAVVVSGLALAAMAVALVGNIYPAPAAPYSYIPYIYVGLLLSGLTWSMILNARSLSLSEKLNAQLDAVAE